MNKENNNERKKQVLPVNGVSMIITPSSRMNNITNANLTFALNTKDGYLHTLDLPNGLDCEGIEITVGNLPKSRNIRTLVQVKGLSSDVNDCVVVNPYFITIICQGGYLKLIAERKGNKCVWVFCDEKKTHTFVY